jgi:uncharacterized membrane protein YkgB
MDIKQADKVLIAWFGKNYLPIARASIFVIFFWFGALKLTGVSPAGPLARALVDKTFGARWFDFLFAVLAALECAIGILFLIPRATRIVIPLLLLHMAIVCSPLLLVPEMTWQKAFVPTLEGQYIIKNLVVIAVAIGIAAQLTPLSKRKTGKR